MKRAICLIGIVLFGAMMFSGCVQTGSGKVTDTIANTERQGLIWKTNEVYLTNDHDAFYCARDPQIFEDAKNYSSTKAKITIEYDTYFYFMPWECGSGGDKYSNGGVITSIKETGD